MAIDLRNDYHTFLTIYCSTLATARQQNLPPQMMEVAIQSIRQSLGEQWADLHVCVAQIRQGSTTEELYDRLNRYMLDWASMEAYAHLVNLGQWVNPQDRAVQNAFWNKLEPQCDWLQSQLWPSSSATDEEEDDDFDDLEEEEDRSSAAQDTRELPRLLPQPSPALPISSRPVPLQQRQTNVDRELFDELRQAHQDARESLRLAMEANRVTSQAITDLVRPATDLINNASKVQPIPYEPYEVPAKPVRRAMRRIWFVVVLGLIVLGLFVSVYIGLHFLY